MHEKMKKRYFYSNPGKNNSNPGTFLNYSGIKIEGYFGILADFQDFAGGGFLDKFLKIKNEFLLKI